MIDLHSHILPALDDGVAGTDDAIALARALVDEGTTLVAATPHVRADFPTSPERMERGVAALRTEFERQGIPLHVAEGGEVDIGILSQLSNDALLRFTLARSRRYLLVEVPYRGSPVLLAGPVIRLLRRGITPVLAHPERNPVVQDRIEPIERLIDAGAVVQVTAASLVGDFGPASRLAAETLLERRLVHCLASDAHGLGRSLVGSAAAVVADPTAWHYLTVEVPRAIVAGADLPTWPA